MLGGLGALRGWVRWVLDVGMCVFERRMWGFFRYVGCRGYGRGGSGKGEEMIEWVKAGLLGRGKVDVLFLWGQ